MGEMNDETQVEDRGSGRRSAGKTASEAAVTGLPITIAGTSSKPIITPDVNGLMMSNTLQITNKLTGLFGVKKK
jgi:hypothetical protein